MTNPGPALDDGDACTTESCASNVVTHTPISGCGAPPSGASGAAQDPTIPTSYASSVGFLYTGGSPIQTSVNPLDIVAERATVVRGRVLLSDGTTPVAGAVVKILGHSEFGQTQTRSDGFYDMVVNGGDGVVVDVQKSGYLTAQRHVSTRWHDYSVASDIYLVARDTTTNPAVVLGSSSWQVVRGTPTTNAMDPDQPLGTTRTATLLFQPGTTVTTPGFSGSSLTIRQTEYTVGGNKGNKAMPAELPATSAYTYAVEFSADEADAQSLASIAFNKPAFFYVENFTGTNYDGTGVLSNVPTGSYDRVTGAWKAESNGIILKVVANSGSSVDLSLDGTTPMTTGEYSTYGIDANERAALAPLYVAGTSLWRTPVIHFSPWDLNWAAGLASDAITPPDASPKVDTPRPDPCEVHGSIVECENQTLRESIPIVGTPFSLVYSSARQAGSRPTINIPLSDGRTVPSTLLRMEADVTVAGRRATYVLPPATNQSVQWSWDRKDPYGNLIQGSIQATVDVRYVYAPSSTGSTASFGAMAGASSVGGNRTARELTLTRSYAFTLDAFDAKGLGLGGWQLDAMQVWDPAIGLVLGTRTTPIDTVRLFYSKAAATGYGIQNIAVGGDGSVYTGVNESGAFPDGGDMGVLRISGGVRTAISDGALATYTALFADNTPLASVRLGAYPKVSMTANGGLLITDGNRVIRVGPGASRPASVIAGGGGTTPATGVQARGTNLSGLSAAVEAPDGSVVVATAPTTSIGRIWRIGVDGKLEAIAGNGSTGSPASGCVTTAESCRAVAEPIGSVYVVAVDPSGNVYFNAGSRIWRISPRGTLRHIAGDTGTQINVNDGLPATQVSLPTVNEIAYRDGALWLADGGKHLIRRIGTDGIIRTIAGDPTDTATGLTGTATTSRLTGPGGSGPKGFAFAPDGSMYIATDWPTHGILQMQPPAATTSSGATLVPSPDGSEVYEFTSDGRHSKTRTIEGGKTKYTFNYTSGKLTSIVDAGGNTTSIAYSSNVTITSPRSGNTVLAFDGNGYLSTITSPATAEVFTLQHSSAGLLQQLTDPNGRVHTFTHSASGRLTRDKNAISNTAGMQLTEAFTTNGWDVGVTTPQGRTTTHQVSLATTTANYGKRVELRTHTSPLGLVSTEERFSDLGRLVTYPDGTTVETSLGPDPRFGSSSPYTTSIKTTSGGKSNTETVSRSVNTMTDPFSFAWIKETRSFSATTADTRSPIEVKYAPGSPTTRTTTTTLGRQIVEQLDGSDRVTRITIPGAVPGAGSSTLVPVDFYYDGNGRLWKIDQNGGGSGSRTTTMTFASGKDWVDSVATPLVTTGYDNFDNAGRPQTTKLPGDPTLTVRLLSLYDKMSNTTKVTMPLASGRDHFFTPTAEDLLGVYTPPSASPGGATTNVYDLDNLLMSVQEPQASANYVRDDMGRVTGVSYPLPTGSNESVTRQYDSSGRLWKVNSSSNPGPVNLTYTYSGKMVTQEAYTGLFSHNINKTYDDYFRLKTRDIDGSNTANFKYDQDGLLNEVNGTWGAYKIFRTTGSTSSPVNGMLTGTELGGPSALTDTYEYDVFGALKRYTLKYAGNPRYDVQYNRDSKGRVLTKTETVWTLNGNAACNSTYGYDADNRGFLVSDSGSSPACPMPFSGTVYDKDGNINAGSGGWTYDLQDRLTADADWNYTHNADGDQVNGTLKTDYQNQWQFDFDIFGNLRRFYGPYYMSWAPIRTYAIDGRNRRVAVLDTLGATTTTVSQMLYDDDRVVAMYRNSAMNHYVYGTKAHVPDLLIRSDGAYRIVSDQLGSVKLVIKTDGTIVEARNYSAWGVPSWTAGSGLWNYAPFGFAGGVWDERANRVRFGARDYNPWASRWVSRDPSRLGGGANFYAYANNDPVNFIDADGRAGEFVGGIAGSYIDHSALGQDRACLVPGICSGPTRAKPPCAAPNADDEYHVEKVTCSTKCAKVNKDGTGGGKCTGHVTGTGTEKTKDDACKAAKKDANDTAGKDGCRADHCNPCECK